MANRVPKYKVGDIVKLKSGGPNMTIDRIVLHRILLKQFPIPNMEDEFKGIYECKWFENDNYHVQDFSEESLIRV